MPVRVDGAEGFGRECGRDGAARRSRARQSSMHRTKFEDIADRKVSKWNALQQDVLTDVTRPHRMTFSAK